MSRMAQKCKIESRQTAFIRFSASLTLLFVAYIPIFKWMIDRWMAPESYYSHGFLIPIVSLYLIWQKKELLKKTEFLGYINAVVLIAAGLFVNILCAMFRVYFISGFSFVIVLAGLILFFFGRKFLKYLAFPLFFMLAMVPLPLVLIGNLTVKLKLFAAQVSAMIINYIGMAAVTEGSIIKMQSSYLLVGAPCSGLRSLVSLLTLGLLFAYVTKMSFWKRVLLFVSSIPIILASNIMRVTLLAFANEIYGEKFALGFFHNFSGILMLCVSILGLYLVGVVLKRPVLKKVSKSSKANNE